MIRTKKAEDKTAFKEQCQVMNEMLVKARVDHYSSAIQASERDQKSLFRLVDNLLHKCGEPKLSSHESAQNLSNTFADFLSQKSLRYLLI